MIKKLLVANRGEIACRVLKSASKLGISTVAVYSDADINAQHVQMADESVYLGEAVAAKSYLNAELIITKAKQLNVDAIHPGYGFLSENAEFADKCQQNDIVFIGPSSDAIRAMGSKSAAKTIMEKAKVPLVPGYHGENQSKEFLLSQANAMGYPVLLKAAAGGGGKGMRQVWKESEFSEALEAAKRESLKSFSDDIMLIEKYLTEPRHVEIQVFCDNHGNGVYLYERDCSVQRRHQKIIEEAPAPGLSEETRTQMGEAALKAAFAIDYTGAGTVEFLLDTDGSFYFLEMNSRLQVVHPVTEFITGEDLVEWQIAVANNLPLPKTQAQLTRRGHSFEARIYAEDPDNNFLPSTGTIDFLLEPAKSEHVRVDSGVVSGDEVSIYYDPMIAKLVVWGESRDQALASLIKCLKNYMVCGLTTNIPYLINVAQSEPFQEANLTTDFIERHSELLDANKGSNNAITLEQQLAIVALLATQHDDASEDVPNIVNIPGFRLNHHPRFTTTFVVGKTEYELDYLQTGKHQFLVTIDGQQHVLESYRSSDEIKVITDSNVASYRVFKNQQYHWLLHNQGLLQISEIGPDYGSEGAALHAGDITAPMNGTLVMMKVQPGQAVAKDDLLAIVEAMKMEHSLRAPFAGTVEQCFAAAGDLVDGDQVLISLTPSQSDKDE